MKTQTVQAEPKRENFATDEAYTQAQLERYAEQLAETITRVCRKQNLTLNATTGAYAVTQNAPIMHAAGSDENNAEFTIGYRVADADGDTVDGSLTVNVDDDTPTVSSNAAVQLDDDALTGGNAGVEPRLSLIYTETVEKRNPALTATGPWVPEGRRRRSTS